MATAYKKEKESHKKLLEMLSKHFSEDEDEILDEEMEDEMEMDEMNPTQRSKKLKRRTPMLDMGDEDDIEFDEDEDEEEDDEKKSLDKEKRKDLAVMVIAKKAGKKR